MTNYPAQIDNSISLPAVVDNLTPVSGAAVNNLRTAILAVEAELGVKPSGSNGSVKARLDAIEASINNLQPIIQLAGDLGNTTSIPHVIGIQGRPISPVSPNTGDVLTWSGIAWIPNPISIGSAPPSGPAGGDLSGIYPNPTVSKIQGNSVLAQTLGNRQDSFPLTWSNTDSKWEAKSSVIQSTQAVWYIDSVGGNDSNDGLTLPTAIKTAGEYTRRTGIRPYVNIQVDIYINNDMDPADILILSGDIGANGSLNVHGIPKVIHSGTLTAVTAYDIATNQADELAAGSMDWTPYVGLDVGGHGQLLAINTGNIDGPSYSWVAAPLTGPTRARVSLLGVRTAGEWPLFEEIAPASPGNTFQILQLPLISNIITDYVAFTENAQFFQVLIDLVTLPPFFTPEGTNFLMSECAVNGYSGSVFSTTLMNSFFTGLTGSAQGASSYLGIMYQVTLQNFGTWSSSGTMIQSSQVFYDVFGQGETFQTHHDAFGVGVFDCNNPFTIGFAGAVVLEAPMWGKNNTGVTFTLYNGGQLRVNDPLSSKLFVENNDADITIDSYSSLPAVDPATFDFTEPRALTIANCIAPVSSGGFGGAVFNPRFPSTGITTIVTPPSPVPEGGGGYSTAIAQTVWHIDQAGGNDSNDGLTSGTAIKTCLEMYRRVGQRPFINHAVDIYIHSDMDAADILFLAGQFGPNALMSYHGVPTVLHSGTLSAVTPYNQVSGQADEITDASVTDWTPYVGKLVVINTGALNGPSYCWVAKALTGPARARVSFLGQRDPSNAFFENIGPASIGNTYQIWHLPVLSNFIFDEASYTLQNATFLFEFLEFPPDANWCSSYILAYECSLPYIAVNASGLQFINPLFTGSMNLVASLNFISVIGLALDLTLAIPGNLPMCINGYWTAYGLICQNSSILITESVGSPNGATIQVHHSAFGFGFFDTDSPIDCESGSCIVLEAPIWGKGNTGNGIYLSRGGRVFVTGNGTNKLLLQTSGQEFVLDNYTALPAVDPVSLKFTNDNRSLTFANFFASVADGGFGGAVFNPRYPSTGICNNTPVPSITNPSPLTQADWYVDWTSGNDNNPGTIGSPVKTVMGGVVAKWGTNAPKLTQTTTLHIVTPQPANVEEINLAPQMIGQVNFVIRGTPTLVATFALGAVTAKNRTTNTDFAAAGFVAGGLAVGQLVHNNAGGKDSWCFIRHLAAGTAKLTQPLAPLTAGTATLYFPTPAEIDTWAVSDSVSVYHPCTINLRSIAATGGGNSDGSVTTPGVWMEYIEIFDGSGIAGTSTFAPSFVGNFVLMQSCLIDSYIYTFDSPNFTTTLTNCYFNGISASTTYIIGGICTTFGLLTTGPNWLDADVIVEASSGWSGEVSIGLVNLALPGTACHGNAEIRIVNGFGYGAVLWGLGTINVQAGSLLWNTSGTTWALSYYVAVTQLKGVTTGAAYVAGSFLDGIAITAANLDTYIGLQDPRSGARIASQ